MTNSTIRIVNLKNQRVIAEKCHVAESFWTRFIGLMGKSGLNKGEGLWIRPTNSIHMWFMRFPIDVIFVKKIAKQEKNWLVSSVRRALPAWKLLPVMDLSAEVAIELPVGSIDLSVVQVGDELCIS